MMLKLLNTIKIMFYTCSKNRQTVVVVRVHDECDHIIYRSTNRAALSTVPHTPLRSDVYRQPPPPMFVVHVTRGESEIPDCFLQIQCNIILRLLYVPAVCLVTSFCVMRCCRSFRIPFVSFR